MTVVQVSLVVYELWREAYHQESKSRKEGPELVIGEKVGRHQVSHEDYEDHRNGPESIALPYCDDYTEERDHSAYCCHVGDSLAKVELVVLDSSQRKDEANVYSYDDVYTKSHQKQVKKEPD